MPVDKTVLKNCRRRLTNLSMAWKDYNKADDVVPHLWILNCPEMVGAVKNMISIISYSMMNWKTVLTSGGVTLVVYSSHAATDTSATKDESWVQRKKMAKDMGSTNHLLFMEI